MFTPIVKKTIVNDIISMLFSMIARGELQAGCPLPSERRLAERLNVSRSSLREALKILSFNGIVESKPGSGSYLSETANITNPALYEHVEQVFSNHLIDFKQIIEARRVIEVESSVLAVGRITETELETLAGFVSTMGECNENQNFEEFTQADLSFHNLTVHCCRNEYLCVAYEKIFPSIVDISRLGDIVPDRHDTAYSQILEIYAALKQKNEEKLRIELSQHIDHAQQTLSMYFNAIDYCLEK